MGTEYTPGPWTVHDDPDNPGFCTIYPEKGHPIGGAQAYFSPEDARLIAVAPDLLARLDEALRCLSDIANAKEGERWNWDWEQVIADGHEAIAKATEAP